jgi:hypothetical protein
MVRLRALGGAFAAIALLAATAGPVAGDPLPATLSVDVSASHYLGGDWEHQIALSFDCGEAGFVEVPMDLPGSVDDALAALGPLTAGTTCWAEITYWPDPGWNAGWDEPVWDPGQEVVLAEGANQLSVVIPRVWGGEVGWPPEEDTGFEHAMSVTVSRVYLNGGGGIEVEGTTLCRAAGLGIEGQLVADAHWTAIEYVGRRTAITATYDSAIAHTCWDSSHPRHGPYAWETRYPYPSGAIQYVYSTNGRFSGGRIHVEAFSQTEALIITQNFAPAGWTSFEGDFVPYDADCEDNNGDGWCVAHHFWYGWAQADLRPIRVR